MANDLFHSAVSTWFERTFGTPTPAQEVAWPVIKRGSAALIAAPTGSGKTLAAFLSAIDELVREIRGTDPPSGSVPLISLRDEVYVLYVSPLKALSNDIHKNLEEPLSGITRVLIEQGHPELEIRSAVRTGDTTQSERNRMRQKPPHILVTTPESLFILLTSDSGRQMLRTVCTVIVDEIHALAANKRGSHLALSLERLEALCEQHPVRIGLSATQKPLEDIARYLVGNRDEPCAIVDSGYSRERDLAIVVPDQPLGPLMSEEGWANIYNRLAAIAEANRTTLIFVNTRRLAERAARHLAERLGEENVTAHHGSLAREHRLNAEQRLKNGELKVLVATASLELGIDIGDVSCVCQMGSPRSISALLQRVGRSGHQVRGVPKGRLFPLTRDDLVECTALLDAVRRGELDRLHVAGADLDVLCQQIIAEVACREWQEDELYQHITSAYPYRDLDKQTYDQILTMLAEGFSTRRGRRSRYLFRDAVNRQLKPRDGARLTAITNAGAIPDQFDYNVVLEPEGLFIGTVNEDFAFESLPGDIVQLGNTSYRILQIGQGKVRVEDAHGQPPNMPFWFGEAPGRSDELSAAVSRLRETINEKLTNGIEPAANWAVEALQLEAPVARQLIDYLAATRAALGRIPTRHDICFERFFDEAGDQHLVIHSPYGSRLNRAWGLALRKRFCRQFNFELQAAALEDSIVISLGATHSFPLEEVTRYLHADTVRDLLVQAVLAAPVFMTRWRWSATIALALRRNYSGKRVPAQFQRMDAEDLIAVVFPDQLACQENLAGEREVPDHPLVTQTLHDCLNDVMDIEGLIRLLTKIEQNEVTIHCKDLNGPSPLAQEILFARPYAFLDDAPAEERRTQAVNARRFMDPADAAELAGLDPAAIKQVAAEAWPVITKPDELHDALMVLGFVIEKEVCTDNTTTQQHNALLDQLIRGNRATRCTTRQQTLWICAERLPLLHAVFPGATTDPEINAAGPAATRDWTFDEALVELLRARLEGSAIVNEAQLQDGFECSASSLGTALLVLENEGYAMRGNFTGSHDTEWCERGLLARIHRYTLKSLRNEIKPVTAADYMRFLFAWHGMVERPAGDNALIAAIDRLEGFAIPAAAWESDILPARIKDYYTTALDQLCSTGRIVWTRFNTARTKNREDPGPTYKAGLLRNTPITLLDRHNVDYWRPQNQTGADDIRLSANAARVLNVLQQHGASFFIDIVKHTGLLRTHAEEALAELAALGLVTSDSYAGLRALIAPANKKSGYGPRHRRRRAITTGRSIDDAGRWSIIPAAASVDEEQSGTGWIRTGQETLNHIAYTLLKRYGVVFHKILERESGLPPWRELLYAWRRMEARGEIRGGRFVEGFSGEQFALAEAVPLLRKYKDGKQELPDIVVSATDPLNLVGIILPGERITAVHTNRILFRNGLPAAKQLNGEIHYFGTMSPHAQWEINHLLTRKKNPAGYVRLITPYSN
jgi:ATP-dependent Lhr-like helicase